MRYLNSLLLCLVLLCTPETFGQLPNAMIGQSVERDVRDMYNKGLQFLVKTQAEDGSWQDSYQGPGITGLCTLTFLATGEDPNFGKYSNVIRKAVRSMIQSQDQSTGYYTKNVSSHDSMYQHGFAMLAMAEVYGSVDDRKLWDGNTKKKTSIAESLELAVRCAVTSQKKNPHDGWRYGPNATDADTSVSGAILVGLLAARNAGIAVPDESIKKSIAYFASMTSNGGQVGYSGIGGHGNSDARSSIACLVFALAKKKDLEQYEATLDYLRDRINSNTSGGYQEYTRYYKAQALFQGDIEAWQKWNKLLIRQIKSSQQSDGSIQGNYGGSVGTSMSLLSLALNFRLLPIYER